MSRFKRVLSLILLVVMAVGFAPGVLAGGATDFYAVPGVYINYTREVSFNKTLTGAQAFTAMMTEYKGSGEVELFDTSRLIKDSTGEDVSASNDILDEDSTYTFEYYFYPSNQYEWPSSIYSLSEKTNASQVSDFFVKVNGQESADAQILYYYGGIKVYVPLGYPSDANLESLYLTDLSFGYDPDKLLFDTSVTGTQFVERLAEIITLPENVELYDQYGGGIYLRDSVTGNNVWDEKLQADRDYIVHVELLPLNGYLWADDIKRGDISYATDTVVSLNGKKITEGYTNHSEYSNILEIAINIGKPQCPHKNTVSQVLKKSTISSNGVITVNCSDCGYSYTKSVAKVSNVKLSFTKKNYTGSAISAPTLTVKDSNGKALVKGTDYTVTGLVKRTNVGRYKVTVTFKGNYSGTKTLYYTITPKAPSSVKVRLRTVTGGYDDVVCSWTKATGASGYAVYYKKASASTYTLLGRTTGTSMTKKDLADGVKYTFKVVPYYTSNGTRYTSLASRTASIYALKKIATPTVTASSGKVKVKWVNINGESGYQISRSTSKTGTNIVSTYSTTSGNYKNVSATAGKTYYYKVRAYKVVNGTKVFGPWSSVRSFKR